MIKQVLVAGCIIVSAQSIAAEHFNGSVAVGYGMIYGVRGVKLEYALTDRVFAAVGLGDVPSAGLQYYFREEKVMWRPKIGLYYGRVARSSMEYCYHCDPGNNGMLFSDFDKNYKGVAVELGQNFQFGRSRRHAIEFGITIRLNDGGKADKERELSNQGYRSSWGDFAEPVFSALNFGYKYNF